MARPPFGRTTSRSSLPEVGHVCEIVAMVVAESVTAAKDAAERVANDRENPPRGARLDSPNIILDGEIGDEAATRAIFAEAAHVVRFDTWVQRICGVPMEPRAAIGEYDPETVLHTLHAGAGGAVSPRRDLAMVLGISPEQARMVMHDVGGNFGTRGSFNAEFALVVWAAKLLGRPVKWTCDGECQCDRSAWFGSACWPLSSLSRRDRPSSAVSRRRSRVLRSV